VGAVRSGFGCLSWVGAGIIVIALVLKVLVFDMAEVGHNGMAPTLLRGERVLINKRATRIDGELVTFDQQGEVSFYNADNDRARSVVWGDEYFGTHIHRIFMEAKGRHLVRKTEVGAGELYLLGDYRAYMGQDSRAYGVVDASTCRGTIVFRITPVDGLGHDIAHRYFEPIR